MSLKRNNSNLIQKWGILKNKRISKFRDWKIQKDRNVLVMQGKTTIIYFRFPLILSWHENLVFKIYNLHLLEHSFNTDNMSSNYQHSSWLLGQFFFWEFATISSFPAFIYFLNKKNSTAFFETTILWKALLIPTRSEREWERDIEHNNIFL